MASHNELGKRGEELAEQFLIELDYDIIARNWRSGKLELDIIAKIGDELVFVEVKTRTSKVELSELISNAKEKSLLKAVNVYLEELPDEVESRVDLINIELVNDNVIINHIENAIEL